MKEVVEVMEKKTTRNSTAQETNFFFLLTLERKILKRAATKEVFDAILKQLKTAFMEESFKTLNEKSLQCKESLNLKNHSLKFSFL